LQSENKTEMGGLSERINRFYWSDSFSICKKQ
jgi:hypothetical protein